MERENVLRLIDQILAECEASVQRAPTEMNRLIRMLTLEKELVQDHWPLTIQEQRRIESGPYGVRVLEGSDLSGLSNRLSRLYTVLSRDALC